MVEQEQVGEDRVGSIGSDPDADARHDDGAPAHTSTASSALRGRRVIIPSSPGWAWLAGVVAVSLALWAGIIWGILRILR